MARDRATPPTPEAACVRAAGDLYGVNPLIADLGIAERTFHNWCSGKRTVPANVLPEIRKLLIGRRQQLGDLGRAIRAVEVGDLTAASCGLVGEDAACD